MALGSTVVTAPAASLMAVDRTADFREAVRRQRSRRGQPTPAAEILPRRQRTHFSEDAVGTMQKISTMARFLHDHHAAYVLDDGLNGMTDAERDEMDAEGESSLAMCAKRIEQLKQLAVASRAASSQAGRQRTLVQQSMVQLLYEHLQDVAGVFDEHRRLRMQRASEARERRLGVAAASLEREYGGPPREADGKAGMPSLAWAEGEVLSDEEMDEGEREQLHLENDALRYELTHMVEQAKEAESSMMQISNLSHLFASKIAAQEKEVDLLFSQAEQTADNLVRGNQYLDSAARHSRDFRMLALTFLIVASFSLLFLDWYYD